MDEKELAFLRKRHVEDTSLTEMNGACRCGSLVFPCQTSRLVAEVDRLREEASVSKQSYLDGLAALRVECDAEVDRLRAELERAHEELRQGWPKLARDANRSAIEQWNRADAAEARVAELEAEVEEFKRDH